MNPGIGLVFPMALAVIVSVAYGAGSAAWARPSGDSPGKSDDQEKPPVEKASAAHYAFSAGRSSYINNSLDGQFALRGGWSADGTVSVSRVSTTGTTYLFQIGPEYKFDENNRGTLSFRSTSGSTQPKVRTFELGYFYNLGASFHSRRRTELGIAVQQIHSTVPSATAPGKDVVFNQGGLTLSLDHEFSDLLKAGFSVTGFTSVRGEQPRFNNSRAQNTATALGAVQSPEKNAFSIFAEFTFTEDDSLRAEFGSQRLIGDSNVIRTPELTYTRRFNESWSAGLHASVTTQSGSPAQTAGGTDVTYSF